MPKQHNLRRRTVQRVDGFYLYQAGSQLHPLSELRAYAFPGGKETTFGEAEMVAYVAEAALDILITRSIFRLRTSVQSGQSLLAAVRTLKATCSAQQNKSAPVKFMDIYPVTTAMTAFEAVLGAELGLIPLYVVMPKAGFDTAVLIESGWRCFPDDILTKAPDAVPDLMQGTRCIAFELFTAAGFHLHRANESVLRRYWDAVTKGAARPATRNMGDYLAQMNKKRVGDAKVKAALKDLKDLHRNPLIHPEHSLESADDAIALMNGVHTAMVYMLKEIPIVAPPPATTPPGGINIPAIPAATSTTSSSGTQP